MSEATPNVTTMGHVALHYQRPEEGPVAARLLKALGLIETQMLPLPNGSNFYRFVVDEHHHQRGDGIVFLSVVPEEQKALTDAARKALKVGQPGEDPAVAAFRKALQSDPEYTFHIGFLASRLDRLEEIFLHLERLNAEDPDMKGRLKTGYGRPRPGNNAEMDARLDASPIYDKVKHYTYGQNGVQAFVETDILHSGPLGDSLSIEFDYVFPGHDSHILSVAEI